MSEEVWSVIDLVPNYQISNLGRVSRIDTGKIIKPIPDQKGYHRVYLWHNGQRYSVYVHRLVAKAFFIDYEEGRQVRHFSSDYSDNSVSNLTMGENCRRGMLW